MTRAVLYGRVSREEQEKAYSLEFQFRDMREYCSQQEYSIVGEFTESGSGHELDERVELTTVRQMMRRGEFDVLVVWKFDRFHRNQNNQAVVMYEAERAGARVESATEKIENTPAGKLVRSILAFKAEQEWEDIRFRTQQGIKARVEAGHPLVGTKPPYGYDWAYDTIRGKRRKSHLLIDEEEARIVRRIFSEMHEGASLRRVAAGLNHDGIPTPKGCPVWNQSTVRHIVKNPLYTGRAVAFRSKQVTMPAVVEGEQRQVKRQRPNSEPVQLPDWVVPPLVSSEVAAIILQRLEQSRSTPTQGKTLDPENYLLRGGYVLCGICGNSLSARRRNGRNHFYICHRGWTGDKHVITVPAQEVDTVVRSWMLELITKPEIVEAALADVESRRSAHTGEMLATLRGVLTELQEEQSNLVDSLRHIKKDSTRAKIGAEIDELDERMDDINKRIQQAQSNDAEWEIARKAIARVKEYGISPNYSELRRILFDFGVIVTVNKPASDERIVLVSKLLNRLSLSVGKDVNTVSLRSGFCPVLTNFFLRRSTVSDWTWGIAHQS
jgi:site-specific DNA recombinase